LKFKLNDWVKTVNGDLIKLKKDWMVEQANTTKRHLIELASNEEVEKYWWNKNDRGVWELKKGDFIKDPLSNKAYEVKYVDRISNSVVAHFGVFDFDVVKKTFRVACFIHERRDITSKKN